MSAFVIVQPEDVLVELQQGQLRSISQRVEVGRIDVGPLSTAQINGWSDKVGQSGGLDPGDVNAITYQTDLIPPGTSSAIKAWLSERGVQADANVDNLTGEGPSPALLTCLGASFHSDAHNYPDTVFTVVWLEQDAGWDLLFPHTGDRVALDHGVVVMFDSALPHGVVKRGKDQYLANDFSSENDECAGMVSFDLDVHNPTVANFMGIAFSRIEDATPSQKICQLEAHRFAHGIDAQTGRWSVLDRSWKADNNATSRKAPRP